MGIVTNSMTFINVWGFLPPATKLWQGNVFTPVCDSVHGEGGSLSRGGVLCPEGGLCPGGLCPGGVCPEVSMSRVSLCGGGVSVQGEVLGLGGVSVQGVSLSRVSLSRGSVSRGGLCQGDPPPYGLNLNLINSK